MLNSTYMIVLHLQYHLYARHSHAKHFGHHSLSSTAKAATESMHPLMQSLHQLLLCYQHTCLCLMLFVCHQSEEP